MTFTLFGHSELTENVTKAKCKTTCQNIAENKARENHALEKSIKSKCKDDHPGHHKRKV